MGNPWHLYDLADAVRQYVGIAVDLETGEITDADAELVADKLAETFRGNVLDVACAVRELEAEAAAVKLEATRLRDRQTALERAAKRIRRVLVDVVTEPVKDARVRVSLGKSTGVEIVAENQIDASLFRVVTEPDAKAIREALESPDPKTRALAEFGATLVERRHVVIR